jgi:hypothetical protein
MSQLKSTKKLATTVHAGAERGEKSTQGLVQKLELGSAERK